MAEEAAEREYDYQEGRCGPAGFAPAGGPLWPVFVCL